MGRRVPLAAALLASALALVAPGAVPASGEHDRARYVDPFIGTLGAGFVFPGPAAPYGMVQLSPDTEGYFAYTGYQWADRSIRGFSHVHVQSMGVREGGNLPFMPVTGEVSTNVQEYQSLFTHARERASAGYYAVHLDSYDVEAELTAGLRVGMHRYTFPKGSDAHVIIDAGREIPGDTPEVSPESVPGAYRAIVDVVDDRTVTGVANPDHGGDQHYAVFFAARFDRAFSGHGVYASRGAPVQTASSVDGTGAGAVVDFDTSTDTDVIAKVGISFVSVENALANLEAELPGDDFDFDALRAETRAAWNDALSVIDVRGGTEAQRTAFYTALYHVQHHPNVFTDANGDYIGHDNAVQRVGAPGDPMPPGSTYYANFSLWDTYRAEMPLLAVIAPARYRDMMRSLRTIYDQFGRLPRWSLMNRDPAYMIGEPALPTIADAFCRGLVPDDAAPTLYNGMRELAAYGGAEAQVQNFNVKGWVPNAPSTTLELASASFSLALVADALGDTAERDAALRATGPTPGKAEAWRNVIDPETGFARPRDANGTWKSPYLPEDSANFKEGTGWQYTWLAPHDYRGLFDVIGSGRGGDAIVEQRLDQFFSTHAAIAAPAAVAEAQQKASLYGIAYYGNQYAPSNEHDLQAPYAYDWIAPWKAQALARAYQSLYRATPDGLPGNDDLGTMSAWFVWSALGFYPEIPGAPVYVIGSPSFEQATIHLEGGSTFVVNAPHASDAVKYVDAATLSGNALDKPWFTHTDLLDAGAIDFTMSAIPNVEWGVGHAPPSMSDEASLARFGCTVA